MGERERLIEENRQRWDALASANVMYSVPFLQFNKEDAARYIYRHEFITDVADKQVLCLASGGGQDSAAFGLLGAHVTVYDLSEVQLQRDRQAAEHHGYDVATVQGDMRDLSVFADGSFDMVWQPYSINFCPVVDPVFREVARVLKPGGLYHLAFANPFAAATDNECTDGGYRLRGLYTDGEEISRYLPPMSEVPQPDGSVISVPHPHEFRHTISTVMNTMTQSGFVFLKLTEWMREENPLEEGSWAHFTQCMPPFFESYWRRA
ncbi:MAG: class I SAM-dependent methyltransferase [Armatimonadota bacterium]